MGLSHPNLFPYTAVVSGLAKADRRLEAAVEAFVRLMSSGIQPNEVGFLAILTACIRLTELELGVWVAQGRETLRQHLWKPTGDNKMEFNSCLLQNKRHSALPMLPEGFPAKMARLRQAKEEAEKEIIAFRAQMEGEFQRKVAESSGDSGANVQQLEQQTEAKVAHLRTEATRIPQDVV
ncbi:hypothetical protein NL676_003728 [Syzygium grande]|nr:hypothetical protein NL676_003728 [Syzygium grande]